MSAVIVSAVIVVLLAGGLYAIWRDHEEQQAVARARLRKRELDAALALTHDFPPRGPKGWHRNSAA